MSKFGIDRDVLKMRFKIGSTYFFHDYKDFTPSDIDEIEFEEHPKLYKTKMQFRKKDGTRCLFKWRKMTPDEFVSYTLQSSLPMEIGKFLIPEINEYLGFTIEHLQQLTPVIEKIDKKHLYEKIIFYSYIQNNAFYLTKEQLDTAYCEYKKYKKGELNGQ